MKLYWYLYTLSFDGIVFYVGSSSWPIQRYKQHCTGDSVAYPFIRGMLQRGVYPEITIINHFEDGSGAHMGEELLNSYFAAIGNKLINKDFNPPYNRLQFEVSKGPCPKNKRNYADFVNKKVEEYLLKNEHIKYNGLGYYTSTQ